MGFKQRRKQLQGLHAGSLTVMWTLVPLARVILAGAATRLAHPMPTPSTPLTRTMILCLLNADLCRARAR